MALQESTLKRKITVSWYKRPGSNKPFHQSLLTSWPKIFLQTQISPAHMQLIFPPLLCVIHARLEALTMYADQRRRLCAFVMGWRVLGKTSARVQPHTNQGISHHGSLSTTAGLALLRHTSFGTFEATPCEQTSRTLIEPNMALKAHALNFH